MRRRAFTLIELLVVVAIIALLISILLPALKTAREQARDVVCRSNISQVGKGLLLYATEWRDILPGTTADNWNDNNVALPPPWKDWLGFGTEPPPYTNRVKHVPHEGTVFKYLNNAAVYRCPTHLLMRETTADANLESKSSYTGPTIVTGAPIPLLKLVRYPSITLPSGTTPQKNDLLNAMLPFIVVEEDSEWYLVGSGDSAWGNWDRYTDRHRGFGALAYVDGHAEMRKMPKTQFQATQAWQTIFELTDGRMVSAGNYVDNNLLTANKYVRMGWLRNKARSAY